MNTISIRQPIRGIALAAVLTGVAVAHVFAQPHDPRVGPELHARGQQTAPASAESAGETRDRLRSILQQYPPALTQVLRLDATLLSRPDYLAPYAALAEFIAQHPEIPRDPAYYVGQPGERAVDNVRLRAVSMLQDMMGGLAFLIGFTIGLLSLGWLIRTALADRRWQRLTKTQTEAHTKLLDRLTSHDDLLAYIQSPAGKRFFEAAPAPLDAGASVPLHAPVARILWSVQAGVVLVAVGLGLFFAKNQVFEEVASPLYVIGIIAVSLGVGFVVSAAFAYVLSRRLGLMTAPAHDA